MSGSLGKMDGGFVAVTWNGTEVSEDGGFVKIDHLQGELDFRG
jgi:hypothetical protein